MKTRTDHIYFKYCNLINTRWWGNSVVKLFGLLVFFTTTVSAQHYQFSQFFAAPTYLNPAFTGANACSRLCLSYRDQWPGVPGTFITTQASFDHYIGSINSGIGMSFFSDKSGYGGLTSNQFNLLYAYELKLTKKYFCRFGLSPGVVLRSVNYNALVFGDQIARGGATTTLESPINSTTYFDCSAGMLLYSKKNWFGVSAIHIVEPNQALLNNSTSDLPMELRVHGGTKFYTKLENVREDKEYISVAFNYKSQLEFDQLDIGAYYTKKPFVAGLWYRGLPVLKAYKGGDSNNDALCFLVGINYSRFNMGYSYDLTISKLTYDSGGAHELSVRYDFCETKRYKIRKRVLVPCPKF